MPNYIDLDEEAARAAARRIGSLGEGLNDATVPPEPRWGEDEFGERMQSQYRQVTDDGVTVPQATTDAKETIGKALIELGENITGAIDEITGQEGQNAGEIGGVHAPYV